MVQLYNYPFQKEIDGLLVDENTENNEDESKDILDDLDIQLLGIKPKDRESKGDYYKSPYVITVECTYDEFGKFLAEIERSPRLITLNEYEVKNGIERVKTNVSEDDLLEQVFELNLATITLVKSRSKG